MFSNQVPVDNFWDINWEANENIPACGLNLDYPEPENLVFEDINKEYFKLVTINIKQVLDEFPGNEGYFLKPLKWYRVRHSFIKSLQGEPIEYPEVMLTGTGNYILSDGRHRLNALMKIYGLETTLAKVWIKPKLA